MKTLRTFEEFLSEGVIKKVKVDLQRAKSLTKSSEIRMNLLKERILKIGVRDDNSNEYVESCHDILMFLIRAKMLVEGYNSSGFKSHEAEVSYMRILGFNEKDIQFVDQMRFFRNGMLYYGVILDKEYAEKVIKFTKENFQRLKKVLNLIN